MNSKTKRWLAAGALGVAAALAVAGWNFGVKAQEQENAVIADRIYIGDVSVAGMTEAQAQSEVERYIAGQADTSIRLKAGDRYVNVQAGDLGLGWANPEIVEKAIDLGKSGNPIARYKEKKDLEKKDKVFQIAYSVDENQVRKVLDENAESLNDSALDNGLKRENGNFVLIEGHDGVEVNVEKSVEDIVAYMQNEWDGASSDIELTSEVVKPRGSKEELAKVKDLLGSYNTNFSSSSAGRAQNVRNGAEKINGSLIYPGDEFSVHDVVVPFSAENGYELAGSYENGTTVETYGGGICQVSTTLYNAVIRAELEITERFSHSMIVNYVEPSMDAAISGDYKDLKFKNSTDAPIYIEGYTQGGVITFNIYGEETRPAGREVSFVSETTGETDPGTQYVGDGGMPIGAMSTQQQSHVGKKAVLWKVVTVNGVEESREKFNSSTYQASPKIVHVGTASASPEAAAAVNAAIASQDQATIEAAIAANSDQALAAQAAAAAEAEAQAQADAKKDEEKEEGKKKDKNKDQDQEKEDQESEEEPEDSSEEE